MENNGIQGRTISYDVNQDKQPLIRKTGKVIDKIMVTHSHYAGAASGTAYLVDNSEDDVEIVYPYQIKKIFPCSNP